MENYSRIESFDHHTMIKRAASNELTLNKINKDDLIMDCTTNCNELNAAQAAQQTSTPSAGNKGVANTNSPKMGLRRIFTPQFKLQVLESYRSDHDCKGNQRATARKYNIHRRQIQKWLQCEPSLRSSVANINQNSIKHQFHNVSMQQQEQAKNVVIASPSSVNNLSHSTSQLHAAHLCLDSTIAAATASHKLIEVPPPPPPPLSSCVSIPTSQETHNILDATVGGAINSTVNSSTPAIVSPLRPSAVISANRNTNSSMPPLLHHHHYGIPAYANLSPTATVPILVHHLTNSPQTPYLYHNINYTTAPTLSHHETEKQHTPYFPPTLFLPTAAAAAAAAAASTSKLTYASGNNEHNVDCKLDLFAVAPDTYPKIITEKSFLFNNNNFHVNYECREGNNPRDINCNSTTALESSFTALNQFNGDSPYSTAYPYGPMDLSLRHNRETKSELPASVKSNLQTPSQPQLQTQTPEIPIKRERNDNGGGPRVVDLTYNRKRTIFSCQQSGSNYEYEYPEKQQKLSSNTEAQPDKLVAYSSESASESGGANTNPTATTAANPSKPIEDDDVEIEVGVEEKVFSATKPVKLFKPYLLDECESSSENNCLTTSNANTTSSKGEKNEATDVCTMTENTTFPDAIKENINICIESSNFLLESRSESPRSICSTAAYIPTMSPTNFKYSKGSPTSSGYESSTSTYSDTSLSSKNDAYTYGQTYSVNLQMQAIYHKNVHATAASYPSKHVQRWLEKDDFNSLETNPTIALFV